MLISEKQLLQLVKFVSFYVNDHYPENGQQSARMLLNDLLVQQSDALINVASLDDVVEDCLSLDGIRERTLLHGAVNK